MTDYPVGAGSAPTSRALRNWWCAVATAPARLAGTVTWPAGETDRLGPTPQRNPTCPQRRTSRPASSLGFHNGLHETLIVVLTGILGRRTVLAGDLRDGLAGPACGGSRCSGFPYDSLESRVKEAKPFTSLIAKFAFQNAGVDPVVDFGGLGLAD